MSDSSPYQKRLATILAMDVAGYSGRVEADEARTLAELGALRRQIDEAAAAHGGRLFHTAGDGFMLEFPTVSGALMAADAVRTGSTLPLRMGVHVGEVSATADGDLLGHGVNVAARLQAKAPVQGVLVSADVVRAVRSELSRRFRRAGRIRLDKMREVLEVWRFEAAPGEAAASARAGGRGRSGWPWLAIAGVAGLVGVLAAIAAAVGWRPPWAERPAQAPRPAASAAPRVAVSPLDVLGASQPDLRQFVGGLQAEMVERLNRNRIDVVSAGPGRDQAAVGYAFGGAVERDGKDLVAHLHLDDARQHVTVWSDTFREPASQADILRDAVASEAAAVAGAARSAARDGPGDPAIVALLIKADRFARRNNDADREDEWQNQRQILDRLPNNAWAHANMAIISGFLAATAAEPRAGQLKAAARAEADTALKLDPKSTNAYMAKTLSYPLVGHWRDREASLLAGLQGDPQSGLLTNHESNFLRQVGRQREALAWARTAAAPRPRSANRDATLLFALAAAGQAGEAAEYERTLADTWPMHPAVWNARLLALIDQARWDDAARLFAPEGHRPDQIGDAEAQAWRSALRAMRSDDAAARARAAKALAAVRYTSAVITMPPYEIYAPGERIGMLALLGDRDEAFREASAYLKPDAYADSSFLFWPALGDFRKDRRFARLLTDTGLVAYWKSAGAWPDFCGEPGLPYDCRTLPSR